MQVGDFVTALVRRWYLTVVAIVLCIAAGLGALHSVRPSYTAVGTTLLLPPAAQATALNPKAPDNPLLYLGDLTQTRDVLMRRLRSGEVANVVAKEPDVTYDVSPDLGSSGPVVVVSVSAPSPRAATSTISAIQKLVPSLLKRLQTELGIQSKDQIESFVLTRATSATVAHKAQIQAAIMAVGAVGGLGFLVIGLVDGLVLSRRRRRASETEDDPLASDGPDSVVAARTARRARRRRVRAADPDLAEAGDDDDEGDTADRGALLSLRTATKG